MGNIVLRIIINALAIAVTAAILPGIDVLNDDIGTYIILGIVIGLVNLIVKPIFTVITLPITCVTLGLFLLVINGIMLLLVGALLPDRLAVDGFLWAVVGGLVMAVVGGLLESAFGMSEGKQMKVY